MSFLTYIKAGYPLLWIKSHEEQRVLTDCARSLSTAKTTDSEGAEARYYTLSWDIADGIRPLHVRDGDLVSGEPIEGSATDPIFPLTWLDEKADDNTILFLNDYHPFLTKECQDSTLIIRKIRNLSAKFKAQGKALVILSAGCTIPMELEKEMTRIDYKLPGRDELKTVLHELCSALEAPYPRQDEPVLDASLGMTSVEAENAYAAVYQESGHFDPALIVKEKAAIVKKSGLLEVIETTETMADIGGLEVMKDWLTARAECFSDKARRYGVEPPKGMLLIGVPGSGKSLAIKAIASIWNRPCLRLDMGRIFGSLVGESENNMQSVLDIAAASSPCLTKGTKILLVDGAYSNIEDLYERYPNGGFDVLGYDENKDSIIPSKVIKCTKRMCDDVYRVSYSDGTKIGYSYNHLQPVMRNGILTWIATEGVQIGDYVAQPIGSFNTSSINIETYLPTKLRYYKAYGTIPTMAESIHEANTIAIGKGGYTDSILSKWPKSITSDLLYLLGLIKSDGSLGKRRIAFTNSDRALCDKFTELLKDLFGLTCGEVYISPEKAKELGQGLKGLNKGEFSEHWVVYSESKIVAEILSKVYKHLHGFSHELILSFLSGYVDGDGCIIPGKYPRIIFCSKKPIMTRVVRDALRRVGIVPSTGDVTGVTVSGKQVDMLKAMRLFSKPKASKLLAINTTSTKSADRVRVYPLGRLSTEMRESLNKKTNHFKSVVSSEFHAWENNQRPVPENRVVELSMEVSNYSKVWSGKLMDIVNSPLKWVRVTSKVKIEPQEVYDLCCEKTHNFIADGILTHNCILWLDEIEKGLSGNQSGHESHETTRRVFQLLLTWMQERKADVFLAATANSVSSLPPELLRAGRIDAKFWVDLPDAVQRQEILTIHLRKRDRDIANFQGDIVQLVDACDKFTGAEIESWVKEALVRAYHVKHEDLTTEDLMATVGDIIPISRLAAEEIQRSRQWATEHGVKSASTSHSVALEPVRRARKVQLT